MNELSTTQDERPEINKHIDGADLNSVKGKPVKGTSGEEGGAGVKNNEGGFKEKDDDEKLIPIKKDED